MKKKLLFLVVAWCLAIGLMYADGDVTKPGDSVIGQPNNNRWPGGEAPQYGIDNNIDTKYLHFRDREENGEVGIIITPTGGTPPGATIVQGVAFTSANDSADRDPINFVLYGSNGAADVGPWTQIASGPIPDFNGAAEWPRKTPTTTPMIFPNNTTYKYYKLMFPDMRGGINSLFQIAEIELLEKPVNGWAGAVTVTPQTALLQLPDETTLAIDATISDFDSTSWTTTWTQVSGPAAVNFNGTENDLDASVTFPATKGNYVLKLDVTDAEGNVFVPRQVRVRVWDPTIDEKMVAHWPFDEADGSTEINDLALDNDKGYLGNYNDEHKDPNFVPGWVTLPEDTLGNAAEFTDAGYIEVYPDVNSVNDPNMLNLDAGVSVASWVYANNWDGNRRVLQYGEDGNKVFRMLHEWGSLVFDIYGRGITADIFPSGEWHHMVGTYDGFTIKLYIDGVEAASETFDTYLPLYAFTNQVLTIGAKNKNVNFNDYPGDYMNGKLDDMRVYSYAIDLDTVRSLVALGQNSAPAVESITVPANLILTGITLDVPVNATIYDAHDDAISYLWEQVSPAAPAVVFSSTTVEDPTVTIAQAGTYVLRLTIDDGVYGTTGTIYKDVEIVVSDANCAKVKADGLLYAADLDENCHVNIYDFALMAADWLKCNDPQDLNCVNPYLP
jgi:hypothetical protein